MLATAKSVNTGGGWLTHSTAQALARLLSAAVIFLTSSTGTLVAEDLFVPDNCTAVVTAHNNSCTTTTMLNCGEEGWRGVSHTRGRLAGISHYSTDWNFVKWETEGSSWMTIEIVPDSGKAMDASVLRTKGSHEASGEFVINTKVLKGQGYVLSGSTKPTGEVVSIGEETFEIFEGVRNFKRTGAASTLNFRLDLLFSQSRDLMLEGRSARAVNDGGWTEYATEPMALRGPGEAGFLATISEFGCS